MTQCINAVGLLEYELLMPILSGGRGVVCGSQATTSIIDGLGFEGQRSALARYQSSPVAAAATRVVVPRAVQSYVRESYGRRKIKSSVTDRRPQRQPTWPVAPDRRTGEPTVNTSTGTTWYKQ